MRRGIGLLLLALPFLASGKTSFTPEMQSRLERLIQFPLVHGRSPAGTALSPDGKRVVFGWNKTGERRLDLWMMDLPNGEPRQILEAKSISRPLNQDDRRKEEEKKEEELYDGGIAGFTWSPDSRTFVFQYRGRTWMMDANGTNLRPLFDTNEQISQPTFSPDGKQLAFVRGQNIFTFDLSARTLKQLTFISAGGTGLYGFDWSPDSKYLSMSWYDQNRTGSAQMMDFSTDRATVRNIGRDWNGDQGYSFQFGVVPSSGGLVKFVEIPKYHWQMSSAWAPNSKRIALVWKDPDSQNMTLSLIDPDTAKKRDIYKETAPKNYIPNWRPVEWTRNSERLLLGTDIADGAFTWRHVISMDTRGRDIKPFYKENHDVSALGRPQDSDRVILATHQRSPLMNEITIVEPDGRRTVHAPLEGFNTSQQFDNSGLPQTSLDGKTIITSASRPSLPPEIYLIEPAVKRMTVSQPESFKEIVWAPSKEVSFPGPDGTMIHGELILPPDMKPGEKIPAVLSDLYANTGKKSWAGYFPNFLATEGRMAVLLLDIRASYGYGGEFHSGYYQRMGVIDADECVAAANYLKTLGFIREDRIGCWGWSYGGFLTCMNLLTKPGVFHAGVAVASVTDWKNYNEGYTRQRLGRVDKNEEVYKKTSPVHHAAGLKDNLLLIHGVLDDNVLAHDTIRLMHKLIEENKHFDVMLYPRDDHGISREKARPHVYVTIARYLIQKLHEE